MPIKKKPTPKKTSVPYSEARKKDPKLDSYIKIRNSSEKGSAAYNAAQNKINTAYGRGPQRTVSLVPKEKSKSPARKTLTIARTAIKKAGKKATAAKPGRLTRVDRLKKRGVKAAAKTTYKIKKAATSKNPVKRTTRILKQGMKKQANITKKILKTNVRAKESETKRKLK